MHPFMTAFLNVAWTSWPLRNPGTRMARTLPFAGLSPMATLVWPVSRAESEVSSEGKTKGENVRGGGVAIIYRDCWRASKINIQDKLTSFEFLCTRVDVKPTSIIVCTVYRSQPITDKFFDEFRRLLEQLVTHRCPLVIVGDFNLHFEKNDNMHTKRFNRLLQSFGLQQHVNNPTHNQRGGILDLFITKSDLPSPEIHVHAPSISDHSLIEGHLPIQPETVFETFRTRSWRKFDKDAFKRDLADSKLFSETASWAGCTTDQLFSSYYLNLLLLPLFYYLYLRSLLDKHLPICKVTRRVEPLTPWFDSDCIRAKRHVRRLERLYHRTSLMSDRKSGLRPYVRCTLYSLLKSVVFGRPGLKLLRVTVRNVGEQ